MLPRWHPLALFILLLGTASSCNKQAVIVTAESTPGSSIRLEQVFSKTRFDYPVYAAAPPDGAHRLFIVEQPGRILWLDTLDDHAAPRVAVDLRGRVKSAGREEGLIGFAFHPNFKTNHEVFLHYTRYDPRRNVLSRFRMDARHETIDPASEEVILEVLQPFDNHKGGMIAFPPPGGDGFLYVALGDGGFGGDPHRNGQNMSTLLSKILRIDVDRRDAARPHRRYAIPADNPFVNQPDARGEIWAYGFRNPWRFSFDRQTGALWVPDVGQTEWEEINVVKKGGNYGWSVREGKHDFNSTRTPPSDLIDPVIEFPHPDLLCIIGGYVYRGKKIPALQGAYLFADFTSGQIYALRYDPAHPPERPSTPKVERLGQVTTPASFAEDADGEIYIVSLTHGLFRLLPQAPQTAPAPQ